MATAYTAMPCSAKTAPTSARPVRPAAQPRIGRKGVLKAKLPPVKSYKASGHNYFGPHLFRAVHIMAGNYVGHSYFGRNDARRTPLRSRATRHRAITILGHNYNDP